MAEKEMRVESAMEKETRKLRKQVSDLIELYINTEKLRDEQILALQARQQALEERLRRLDAV